MSLIIAALDPGYEQSALVVYDGTLVLCHYICDNAVMLTQCVVY